MCVEEQLTIKFYHSAINNLSLVRHAAVVQWLLKAAHCKVVTFILAHASLWHISV